jgi:hypothetical protein
VASPSIPAVDCRGAAVDAAIEPPPEAVDVAPEAVDPDEQPIHSNVETAVRVSIGVSRAAPTPSIL